MRKIFSIFFLVLFLARPVFADSYTKLLLHLNGSDGATSTTDSSDSNHTINFNDNAQLDTAQKKFGTASLLLDGTNDYIYAADSDDWTFGSDDFTIDFWVRFNVSVVECSFLEHNVTPGSLNNLWKIETTAPGSPNSLAFRYYAGGSSEISIVSDSWSPSIDTWYHIALVNNSGTYTFYIDGTDYGGGYDASSMSNLSANLAIGASEYPTDEMRGWMDEVRISKGIARWTTGFTPPSSEYSDGKNYSAVIGG